MNDSKRPEPPERILLEEGLVNEDALDAAREETITVLSECFARDVLTVEDFERRAELVHGARTMADLGAAIDGIRTGGLPARVGGGAPATVRRAAPGPALAAPARPHDTAVAVFGETKREGRWTPATRNTAVAVMGSAVIDLRDAVLGPGQIVISAVTFMGSVEVIVPPGVQVECSGSAVFGSFEQQREFLPFELAPGAPQLRVEGFAVFGSVEIQRREPGETKREARQRRRREKREMRRLRSRR